MKKVNLVLSLILTFGMIFSCTKEVEGPQGPQGPQGQAGPGASSTTFNVPANAWQGDGDGYYVTITNVNILTQDIVNNGAVLLYWNIDGEWVPLPASFVGGSWTTHMFFTFSVGEIYLEFQDDDGFTPNPGSEYGTTTFRVVAIAASGLAENPNLDKTNYEEVIKTFNL